ncbi:Putative GAF domain nucleotide-binding protein [[Torrubiella] hemipterigena]|uniref:Putative GAF domain nucleotide-binding protein n=1 Tax=[Torrubiella] hemipterigena TaxID=1531966 RepID=A0A0A1SR99_9HYPO|nr:Putative GAF domain nucleotide-binding protein [[Torrubiella] hemipterigena]
MDSSGTDSVVAGNESWWTSTVTSAPPPPPPYPISSCIIPAPVPAPDPLQFAFGHSVPVTFGYDPVTAAPIALPPHNWSPPLQTSPPLGSAAPLESRIPTTTAPGPLSVPVTTSQDEMAALGLGHAVPFMDPTDYLFASEPHPGYAHPLPPAADLTSTDTSTNPHLYSLGQLPSVHLSRRPGSTIATPSSSSVYPATLGSPSPSIHSSNSNKRKGLSPTSPAADSAGAGGDDDQAAIKRQRNTIAARKYRQKRLDRISDLEKDLGDMTKERDDLKLQLARREAEVEALREMLLRK